MKTTLKAIWEHDPCSKDSDDAGWGLLTKNLGTDDLDKEVTLSQILESNGIKDAIWALRCFDFKDYCLFLSGMVESALPAFEKACPDDMRPRLAIQGIKGFHAGKVTLEKIKKLADAADADAADAATAVAYADSWREIETLFKKHFCGENQ